MDTRWVQVSNSDGSSGFRARRLDSKCGIVNKLFHFSAIPYRFDSIDSAKHPNDLIRCVPILRLDAEVSGVGTGACGPAIRDEYQVKMGSKEFEFLLEPFD